MKTTLSMLAETRRPATSIITTEEASAGSTQTIAPHSGTPPPGLKTTDDAGHMASVQVMPPTRARLLDEQFPFDDAYGGRHAAAQEPLATMRQNLADPNHPAQTWKNAFEELSPRDQKLVKDLEDQENGLNFAAQDRSLNRGSFRTQFEGPTLDASGPRQFSVEQVGHNAGGRPSGFNVSSSTIGTNGSTSTIVPPTFFPN